MLKKPDLKSTINPHIRKDLDIAKLSEALAHPLRIAIVRHLRTEYQAHEKGGGQLIEKLAIEFDESEETIRYHIDALVRVGTITTKIDRGQKSHVLNREFIGRLSNLIDGLLKIK